MIQILTEPGQLFLIKAPFDCYVEAIALSLAAISSVHQEVAGTNKFVTETWPKFSNVFLSLICCKRYLTRPTPIM